MKPGTNLTLNVGSYVNSTVSLSCIDQSVLLLASGNDFVKSDVFSALDSYDYLDNNYYWQSPQDEQPFGVRTEIKTINLFINANYIHYFQQINLFALKWILPYPRPPGSKTTPEPSTTIQYFLEEAVNQGGAIKAPVAAPQEEADEIGKVANVGVGMF